MSINFVKSDEEGNIKEIKYSKTSEAYSTSDGRQQFPTITISGSHVTTLIEASRGSLVQGTSLRGDKKSYTIPGQNGAMDIEPGVYRHIVYGTASGMSNNPGYIKSWLFYD